MDAVQIQSDLNILIDAKLSVDGIIGHKTQFAIRNFQRIMGIEVDSTLNEETIKAIEEIKSKPICKFGSGFKYAVRWIQWELGVSVDGIFGIRTSNVVRKFQIKNGLDLNAVVDDKVWERLLKK